MVLDAELIEDAADDEVDQVAQAGSAVIPAGCCREYHNTGLSQAVHILDLQDYMTETENGAVLAVYQNLLMGSINHLRSFVRTYERQTGESYQPQFMSQEAYDELMSDSAARGNGGGIGMNSAPQGRGQGRSN